MTATRVANRCYPATASPLGVVDFRRIASIHKARLSGYGLLSECSVGFLARFYTVISQYDTSILLVESVNGVIAGFTFCTVDSGYQSRFLRQNLALLATSPSFYWPAMKAMIARRRKRNKLPCDAELVYIAVSAEFSGQGVARRLIQRAEEEFRCRRILTYCLTTSIGNTRALDLYQSLGFEVVDSLTTGLGAKHTLQKYLDSDPLLRLP